MPHHRFQKSHFKFQISKWPMLRLEFFTVARPLTVASNKSTHSLRCCSPLVRLCVFASNSPSLIPLFFPSFVWSLHSIVYPCASVSLQSPPVFLLPSFHCTHLLGSCSPQSNVYLCLFASLLLLPVSFVSPPTYFWDWVRVKAACVYRRCFVFIVLQLVLKSLFGYRCSAVDVLLSSGRVVLRCFAKLSCCLLSSFYCLCLSYCHQVALLWAGVVLAFPHFWFWCCYLF